jgi:ABC-2 type transport system permease protein
MIYFALGLVWAAAMAVGVAVLWRKASSRIIVQGG